MSVRAILNVKGHQVVTIPSSASIRDAVARLDGQRIGAVVVSDDGETVAGILSERDIIRALARQGGNLLDRKVAELMTASVTVASIDMHIDKVLEMMTQGRFRHMPVVENGKLAGVVSIGDAVKARLDSLESETIQLKEYIVGR